MLPGRCCISFAKKNVGRSHLKGHIRSGNRSAIPNERVPSCSCIPGVIYRRGKSTKGDISVRTGNIRQTSSSNNIEWRIGNRSITPAIVEDIISPEIRFRSTIKRVNIIAFIRYQRSPGTHVSRYVCQRGPRVYRNVVSPEISGIRSIKCIKVVFVIIRNGSPGTNLPGSVCLY